MALRTAFITLALIATPLANAEPASVEAFAQPVLLGMQLSAKHGQRRGAIADAQLACVQALSPGAFYKVVGEVMAAALTSLESAAADRFFSTPVGQKYLKLGLLQIYPAVGEQAPESLPQFSDSEYRELEKFAATATGEKLIARQVMQSASAKQLYGVRIRELMEQCRAQ